MASSRPVRVKTVTKVDRPEENKMEDTTTYHRRRADEERSRARQAAQCWDRDLHLELAELHDAAAEAGGHSLLIVGEDVSQLATKERAETSAQPAL